MERFALADTHKLDGTVYAIKKIVQRSVSALSGVLSEVMLLSRLNNPFIVRYYTAWIEEEGPGHSDGDSSSSSDNENLNVLAHFPESATRGLDFISSGGYAGFEFGYDSDDDEARSQAVEDEDEDEDDSGTSELVNVDKKHPTTTKEVRRRSSVVPDSQVTLYIQMEYCANLVGFFSRVRLRSSLIYPDVTGHN